MKHPVLIACIIFLSNIFPIFQAEAAEKVSLQLRWDNQYQFAGYFAAVWKGYYDEAGIDVEIRSAIQPNNKILSAVKEVSEGRADFGIGAADILIGIDEGADLSVLAAIFQQSATRFYYKESTRIDSLADLTRLRVARKLDDLLDVEFQAMLRSEGIDPSSIPAAEHVPGSDHLIKGLVDVMPGYSITVPYFEETTGVKLREIRPSTYGIDFYGDSIFSTRRLTKEKPKLVQKFIKASIKGWEYALGHPEEIAGKIARDLPRLAPIDNVSAFNRFQIKGVENLTLFAVVELGHINPNRWRRMHDFLKQIGIVKNELNLQNFIFDPVRSEMEKNRKTKEILIVLISVIVIVTSLLFTWIKVLRKTIEKRTNDLRNTNEILRQSEEKFKCIYHQSPIAIEIYNAEGLLVDANPQCLELFGINDLGEVKGFKLFDDPNLPPGAKEDFLRVISVHYAHEFDFNLVRYKKLYKTSRSGKAFINVHITPLFHPNNELSGYLVQVEDITERKRVEAENEKLQEQLFQIKKSESLDRMAGSIAHHFNNLLSVVMGNLELVLDDLPDDAENRENLSQAFEAGGKAAEVSQQMLRYLGHISGNQTTINLSDVCRQSLALLQSALPRDVTLNVDLPDSGPFVHADADQIQQVLTNSFSNAQESLPDNKGIIGLIIQTVSHEEIPTSKRFPLDWQPRDITYACLEISDTGCGISKEDIVKIFDPFYTTKFIGRGMGLPVTMGILKTHDGCITVDSQPENGTVFRIYLPLTTEKKPFKHEKVTKPKENVGNGDTVLLIEDEESVRNTVKIMISRLGYKVIEAQDGVEAVRLFQEHQNEIDCVLSDLTMPRMNGWETLTALREKGADVPVILASGYDENTVMAGDHPELPQAFLNKPYSMAALKDVLLKIIRL